MEGIQNFIRTVTGMQWSDYLDIIVVAFLIYKLLPLIRTPSTMRIARTVVALVLIAWITDAMKLHTLSWILNQILAIGLLAFVVLFQPELRQMLNHLSSVKLREFFGLNKPVEEIDIIIEQTVEACVAMGEEKCGALIVFERTHQLDEFIKTGTPIDGQVSAKLLRNLFVNKTPLHDGAVIIRDGRLAAAGCVLPVHKDLFLPGDLGTRHLAGKSMSVDTDAVVIVVSEESGKITAFIGGVMKRPLDKQTLNEHLHKELRPKETNDKEVSLLERIFGKSAKKEGEDDSNGKK